MQEAADDAMPEGFVVIDPDDPFEMYAGPFYARDEGEARIYCFRVKPHHANAGGAIHGGVLMSFADFALCAEAVRKAPGEVPVTISLNADFTAPAQVGELVTARIDTLRTTRSFSFVRGELTVGDRVVLGCSGVIKRVRREG